MEQIYTIEVNEAFEASERDAACGCPMCTLYNKLEENELEIILGASMMEPDVRIRTNERGFCRTHYDMMFVRKNRLGMGLTLESHLNELKKEIRSGGFASRPGEKPLKRIGELEKSCYVCERIDVNFTKMTDTVVYLWQHDEAFPRKVKAQPYFCLPHYRLLLSYGKEHLPKKLFPDFAGDLASVVEPYLDKLSEDVSWFCKKFDYRYHEEPWKDSRDAVERAIRFLRADLHRGEGTK